VNKNIPRDEFWSENWGTAFIRNRLLFAHCISLSNIANCIMLCFMYITSIHVCSASVARVWRYINSIIIIIIIIMYSVSIQWLNCKKPKPKGLGLERPKRVLWDSKLLGMGLIKELEGFNPTTTIQTLYLSLALLIILIGLV